MPALKRITVKLDERMLRALKAAAEREDRSQAKIVRMALARHLGVEDTVTIGGEREKEQSKGQQVASVTG